MASGLSAESQFVLREAGWVPGRQVDVSRWVRALEDEGIIVHGAARRFLAEFGGLAVEISGPGANCARAPFEFGPLQCLGEEDRFLEWSEETGRSICPVGVLDRGRFFLGIDEQGEILLVETWVASFGRMPTALDSLVRGARSIDVS